MRTSTVRQIPYVGSDFYEISIKIETREFLNKSVHYAESAARNWDAGIIKNDK